MIQHKNIIPYTSLKPEFSRALCNFGVAGMTAGEVHNRLFSEYKIHTSPVQWEKVNGPRITPHVYTTKYDLDRLTEAMLKIAGHLKISFYSFRINFINHSMRFFNFEP